MPVFTYRAADMTGRVVEGVLDGESETEALRSLEQKSLTPLTIRQAKNRRAAMAGQGVTTRIRLRQHQLLEFTRQLKVMLRSGITLLSALGTLRSTTGAGPYRELLDRIAADIQRGATLSEALAAHPRTFDGFYIGTIRAGEAAGVHPEALDELIKYYERRAAARRQLINALTYPAIVVVTLVGACAVMLTWVVPQFRGLFAGLGAELPLPTRILLGASNFLTNHGGLVALGVALAAVGFWLALRTPAVRSFVGRVIVRIPLLGQIIYLATVVQFARMIALLEGAGLPLLETLHIVEKALLPGSVRNLTADVRRKVAGGNSISASISGTNVLPKLVEHMISVGETTGNIDELLIAAAEHYEEKMQVRMRRLTTALEPLLVLVVSSMVLFVALAIFLPVWRMNSVLMGS